MMINKTLIDSILRIGEVSGIEGRKITVKVDKNKNVSDLLYEGTIIKNISVGNYIEIRKGFLSIIGKTDGEFLEEIRYFNQGNSSIAAPNFRYLKISLVGYIGQEGRFIGGIKELPLLGNEAFILTDERIHHIHNFSIEESALTIQIAKTESEEIPIKFPVDGIFNSHIAIFGNTGSGKSNTLASLYQGLFDRCGKNPNFTKNCKFLFFDFNGEYVRNECITNTKKVLNLSTDDDKGDKVLISPQEFFDADTISILIEATEKTQKPFIKRASKKYLNWLTNGQNDNYIKNTLQNHIVNTLRLSIKELAERLLDYIQEIFQFFLDDNTIETLRDDIKYHSKSGTFYLDNGTDELQYFNSNPDRIHDTNLYKECENTKFSLINEFPPLKQFYIFVIFQLINDLLKYKVQNDHVYPVINRLKSRQSNISKIIKICENPNIWNDTNCLVMNLHKTSLEMKKIIPLLVAKSIYQSHKKESNTKSLNIIIDEAHNILSKSSTRETDEWKDYRLETFEEIIKEGRKYGVFLTIASQRPNDISETIISQAHNYFIHQLINERDLQSIGNAVSYIDKVSEESIPVLPVGTCIFSGISASMPIKVKIDELPDSKKPKSNTLKFKDLLT